MSAQTQRRNGKTWYAPSENQRTEIGKWMAGRVVRPEKDPGACRCSGPVKDRRYQREWSCRRCGYMIHP